MVWYSESARWILLSPTPTPAGDKPPHYISQSPALWIPAFAGMECLNDEWESRGMRAHPRPRNTNLVTMTNWRAFMATPAGLRSAA